MTLGDILIVSVPVSDQDRAKHFYVEQLGFELTKDGPFKMAGQHLRWVEVAPKGARTALALTTWWSDLAPLAGMSIFSTDIDADYNILTSRGVIFDGPPRTSLGMRIALFSDPDGNRWHLTQVSPPSPHVQDR